MTADHGGGAASDGVATTGKDVEIAATGKTRQPGGTIEATEGARGPNRHPPAAKPMGATPGTGVRPCKDGLPAP